MSKKPINAKSEQMRRRWADHREEMLGYVKLAADKQRGTHRSYDTKLRISRATTGKPKRKV